MSEWQPIETAPFGEDVYVAFHGHGENRVAIARLRVWPRTGNWGDWDYINSHDGEPQYWMPVPPYPDPPDNLEGPRCGCDGCTEKYCENDCCRPADQLSEGQK